MFQKIPKSVRLALPVIVIALVLTGWMRSSHGHTVRSEWAMDWIAIALDLTPDQQTGLHVIGQELLAEKQAFDGMHEEFHETFMAQIKADRVDQEGLNRLFEEKEQQWQTTRVNIIQKIRNPSQPLDVPATGQTI